MSQVSDNISGLLNQSDLVALEGQNIGTAVFEPKGGMFEIEVLREAQAEKRARKSQMDAVLANPPPLDQPSRPPMPSPPKTGVQQQIEQGLSLNLTESAASRAEPREDVHFTLSPEEAGRFSSLQAAVPQEKEV